MTMRDADKRGMFQSGAGAAKPDGAERRTRMEVESETRAGAGSQVGTGAEPARVPDPSQGRNESQKPVQSGNQSQGQSRNQDQDEGQVACESGEASAPERPGLEQEIESLRAEAAAWKEKAEFNWDQFLRARADLDNYRKRMERDLAFRVRLGKRDLILGFLEVLDNLERVLEAGKGLAGGSSAGVEQGVEGSSRGEQGLRGGGLANALAFIAGVEMIKRQMEALLRREGVVPVDCLGKPFDPSLEEATEVVEGKGEPGTVVEVVLKGYIYEGDLLRAARVKVAK